MVTFTKKGSTEPSKGIYHSNLVYASKGQPLTVCFKSNCIPSKYKGEFVQIMVVDDPNEYALVVEPDLKEVIDAQPLNVWLNLTATGGPNVKPTLTLVPADGVAAATPQAAPQAPRAQPVPAGEAHTIAAKRTVEAIAILKAVSLPVDAASVATIFSTILINAERR
jgi:hypothetical protein